MRAIERRGALRAEYEYPADENQNAFHGCPQGVLGRAGVAGPRGDYNGLVAHEDGKRGARPPHRCTRFVLS
jgi:hypothetical protein